MHILNANAIEDLTPPVCAVGAWDWVPGIQGMDESCGGVFAAWPCLADVLQGFYTWCSEVRGVLSLSAMESAMESPKPQTRVSSSIPIF